MGATDATEPTAEQHDHPRRRAAAARLAVASGLGATALLALADVAHARIAVNHNEVGAADRRTNRRPSRGAAARLVVASGLGATALVALADVAHARIALNHNETAGRDRR